jgi:putative Holliday junction resolvase
MLVLAIDVGTVRIGCAWGDDSVKIPFPLAVWERAQGRAEQALIQEIQTRKAGLLVVGLPLGPAGEMTPQCDTITSFVRRLSKRASIQIAFVDEAFTSDDALERLRAAGAQPTELDAYAACLILESFFSGASLIKKAPHVP